MEWMWLNFGSGMVNNREKIEWKAHNERIYLFYQYEISDFMGSWILDFVFDVL